MTPMAELSPVYRDHPLLWEVQQRDFEIARLGRRLAAADEKISRMQSVHRRVVAAFRRKMGTEQGVAA